MNAAEMRERTKMFGVRIVRMVSALPQNRIGDVLGKQILRSGTSVGANDREALRASSRQQFLYSVEICLREADETASWMELIKEANLLKSGQLKLIVKECE